MSAIPPWAVKGAKVVCVDAAFDPDYPIALPVAGGIYTLNAVDGSDASCTLVELPQRIDGQPCWWRLRRFRPAIEGRSQEQDIAEHFKPLLKVDQREPAKERV